LEFKLRYTAIQVRDLDRALDFYTHVLGMRLTTRTKVPETRGEFAVVRSGDSEHYLEINWYENQQYHPGDELDHIAFEVTNLDVTLSELSAMRISPVRELVESPNSKWTYITDPDGIWIEIFQKKR
jgi:lactoylglutathione lyase